LIEDGLIDQNEGMENVTTILEAIERGDLKAANRLIPLVYEELRRVAACKLAQEKPGQTLSPTALVHEAYVRMFGSAEAGHWRSRGQFFAAAAESMRRILVDNARRKKSLKRGGNRARHGIDVEQLADTPAPDSLVELDEALSRLEAREPEVVQLVKLRYFAGLTNLEAAQVLGISPRTGDAWWAYARGWLLQQLEPKDD
jgi:RNA polymerase sigma factor (TIGR02999 family)